MTDARRISTLGESRLSNAVILQTLLDKLKIHKLYIDDASMGKTPVHVAVESDSSACQLVLSYHGASMVRGTRDTVASEDFTPLHLSIIVTLQLGSI
jgi:hypothetical protein